MPASRSDRRELTSLAKLLACVVARRVTAMLLCCSAARNVWLRFETDGKRPRTMLYARAVIP